MVGLVISDSFLLVGEWDSTLDYYSLKGVSKIDYAELDNAINGAMREISTRYDFKNSKSQITRNENFI